MNKNEKIAADNRHCIFSDLTICEDCCADRDFLVRIRRVRRELTDKPLAAFLDCAEIKALIIETRDALRQRQLGTSDVNLNRIEKLAKEMRAEPKKRGVLMGLISKLFRRKTNDGGSTREALLKSREKEAEQKIFALEKKIAALSEQHASLINQFKDKVNRCALFKPESYEYQLTRQQALRLRPQIDAVVKQISMHAKLLDNNTKYQAMLMEGLTTFQLRDYMPNLAEADTLMKMITEETREIMEDIADYGESVKEFGGVTEQVSGSTMSSEYREFDDMIEALKQERREERAAPEPAPAQAEPAAEPEAPAPEPEAPAERAKPKEELA